MAHSKLTQELIDKASKYISEGHYTNIVCQFLGIAETTFYSYVNQGKEDIEAGKDTMHAKFLQSIKEAEAIAEMTHLQNILKTAQEGTWQASAWYLERKHKSRWSTKQEIEQTATQTIRVEITND